MTTQRHDTHADQGESDLAHNPRKMNMTRMTLKRRLAVAALAPALLLTVTACGGDTSSSDADGARKGTIDVAQVKADPAVEKLVPADVKGRGSLTMAADLHYPPTSFLAEDNKTPVGYNVEIAQLLGKKMGLKIKIKNVSFDTVIPGIAAGRFDFTATNMSPTPERLKVLDMVKYWNAGSSLVFSKGNPLKLSITDQMTLCGHKIAVIAGATQAEIYLPQISDDCEAKGKKAVNAVVLPNVQGALTQLASKRIEGSSMTRRRWRGLPSSSRRRSSCPRSSTSRRRATVSCSGLAKDSPLTPALLAAMQSLMDGPDTRRHWPSGGEHWAIPTASVAK